VRALTLQRPWGWAIANLGKDVENRVWSPPRSVLGTRIAIHEGKVWDEEGALWIEELLGRELPAELQRAPGGEIVCTVLVDAWCTNSSSRWAAVGKVHWVLRDLRRLAAPVQVRTTSSAWC